MTLLKGAAAFIAWLSGSLAAIAGFLYAFGYFATLANLHLLGLDSLILSFDPLFYLQRGSRFTLYVVRLAFQFLVDPLAVVVALSAVGLVIRRIWRERPALKKIERAVQAASGVLGSWNSLLYVLLLLVMLLHMLPTYANLTNVLGISDLLFESPATSRSDAETTTIRNALIHRDGPGTPAATLRTKFLFSLFFFLEAGLVLYLAWRIVSRRRLKILLVSPFALVFAMSLISLPLIYGAIALPNEYATVRITPKDGRPAMAGEFYLLNATTKAFVLWDSRSDRLLWLPFDAVENAHVGRKQPLPLSTNADRE